MKSSHTNSLGVVLEEIKKIQEIFFLACLTKKDKT